MPTHCVFPGFFWQPAVISPREHHWYFLDLIGVPHSPISSKKLQLMLSFASFAPWVAQQNPIDLTEAPHGTILSKMKLHSGESHASEAVGSTEVETGLKNAIAAEDKYMDATVDPEDQDLSSNPPSLFTPLTPIHDGDLEAVELLDFALASLQSRVLAPNLHLLARDSGLMRLLKLKRVQVLRTHCEIIQRVEDFDVEAIKVARVAYLGAGFTGGKKVNDSIKVYINKDSATSNGMENRPVFSLTSKVALLPSCWVLGKLHCSANGYTSTLP
ncbi:hypothetical protein C8J56DRAFT_1052815 [Mycena floridula]|nr:hypothetical protein C8J56DRAFT_1052815 [Mycena floridula]